MGLLPFSRSRAATQRIEDAADDADGLDAFLPETPGPADPASSRNDVSRRLPQRTVAIAIAVIAIAALAAVGAYRTFANAVPANASLRVESDPSNADVRIDGTSRGRTPLTIELPPGRHALVVGDASRARSLSLDLAARTNTVHHVELPVAAAAGTLEVVTNKPGAITVDGADRGATPIVLTDLSAGQHDVVVTTMGTTYRRTVTVKPGAASSLVFGDAPAAATAGWLSAPTPVPLTILENGRVIGTTESDRIMLPAGDHQFEFRNDTLGFQATRRLAITAGRVSSVKIDLPQVPMQINAVPWAEVWIDGKRIGETPLANILETIGAHEVLFKHPQLGERRLTATVTIGTPARATVDMRAR